MNHFSETSKARLQTCHRDLQTLFAHVIQDYDCTIICGYRDQQEQDKAFAEGKSKLKYPASKHNHNPSLAVDAAPYENGRLDWTTKQMYAFAYYVKGRADQLFTIGTMKHRIRLGADWNRNNDVDDESFIDLPHFEIILNQDEI